LLAKGQIHGGVAQGIAQALYEEVSFGEDGQPGSGSLVDYTIPSAPDLPHYETDHQVTPTSFNPLGAKGLGESGATAAPQAVVNAVVNALAHLGVRDVEMPCTPQKVWRILQAVTQNGS
jgi:aerobic carbon-monoxide dehydrogenase large subunit